MTVSVSDLVAARTKLHDLELERGIYTLDAWVLLQRWIQERLDNVTQRLTSQPARTTTFEEVAEQKGQIRELRAILERPEQVDKEIHHLREQLRAAQETE